MFELIADNMELSEENRVVTRVNVTRPWGCNHGINQVASTSNCIYQWDLKIRKLSAGGCRIGIVSDVVQSVYDKLGNGYYYLFWNFGYLYNNAAQSGWPWISDKWSYKAGDKVSIILDLREKTAKLLINDKDYLY